MIGHISRPQHSVYERPGIRKQIVEKFFDHYFQAAYSNVQIMKNLIRKINKSNIIEFKESDLLFMLYFLTLYDGLYARLINILYEAVKVQDQSTDEYVSTTRKAKRLAGEGIDVRNKMWVDIRNAAAHMGFVANGGSIEIKEVQKLIVTAKASQSTIDKLKGTFGKERIDCVSDVVSPFELGTDSLYLALRHWFEMREGPWRLFSKEFFTTWQSFCIARDAEQRMRGMPVRELPVREWDSVVRDARMKLTTSG